MKTLQKDKLTVKIGDSCEETGKAAARDAADYLSKVASGGAYINVVFAAAPSQNAFLDALLRCAVPWERVRAFHMDEYIGLPDGAQQNFGNYLERRIFSKAPFKSVHYIRDCGAGPEELCRKYARIIADYPPDVVFMGIGENAHIAFNDPAFAKFNDKESVKIVELDEICRRQQVNDGCFRKVSDVPKFAVTLTIPALMSARKIFCVVPYASKADAVRRVFFGKIEEACPASILRLHSDATMYCDRDSAKYIL